MQTPGFGHCTITLGAAPSSSSFLSRFLSCLPCFVAMVCMLTTKMQNDLDHQRQTHPHSSQPLILSLSSSLLLPSFLPRTCSSLVFASLSFLLLSLFCFSLSFESPRYAPFFLSSLLSLFLPSHAMRIILLSGLLALVSSIFADGKTLHLLPTTLLSWCIVASLWCLGSSGVVVARVIPMLPMRTRHHTFLISLSTYFSSLSPRTNTPEHALTSFM